MAAVKILPPRDLVRRLLDYDPMTGNFIWRPRPREMFPDDNSFRLWNLRYAERPAGSISSTGHRVILINRNPFKASRLAWLYVHGEPIPNEMDHADRKRWNDAIDNLRAATRTQNMANGIWPNSTTGIKGVTLLPSGRFQVRIGRGGSTHLGTFDNIEEAAAAYREAAIRLFGEFARW